MRPFKPTDEQRYFIGRASPRSVLRACPGSGKTETSVRRFLNRAAVDSKQGIGFLSYTNVAVDEAFKRARDLGQGAAVAAPNLVSTLDSFFFKTVFVPFVPAVLGVDLPEVQIVDETLPPSVLSANPNLDIFGIINGQPLKAWTVHFALDGSDSVTFRHKTQSNEWIAIYHGQTKRVWKAKVAMLKLGYATYSDVLLWSYVILSRQEYRAAKIVASRFRELIVDEAQDTSFIQQRLLRYIASNGTEISYVGDPLQGIYGFSGANPAFLDELAAEGYEDLKLTTNFRSNSDIVAVVNRHFGTNMKAVRPAEGNRGAYIIVGDAQAAINRFVEALGPATIAIADAAIVVRKRSDLRDVLKEPTITGLRGIPRFALRAWRRERAGNLAGAMDDAGRLMREAVAQDGARSTDLFGWKRLGWEFLRGGTFPVPGGETPKEWGRRLATELRKSITSRGLKVHPKFGSRASTQGLPDKGSAEQRLGSSAARMRTTVIHGVKGESIQAVLLIAPKKQHDEWLAAYTAPSAAQIEERNVCYVAFTRAADLLVIQCPDELTATRWRAVGFKDLA